MKQQSEIGRKTKVFKRNPQLKLLKDQPKAYGGTLLNARKGRMGGRPLDTKQTMHLVLMSSKARGDWSFWNPKNKHHIQVITSKFSKKYGIKILSLANVGNHLHFQFKLSNRFTYAPFIRAITAAIAMTVTQSSRWNTLEKRIQEKGNTQTLNSVEKGTLKRQNRFWDHRPFTRVVQGYRAFLTLRDYININQLEGFGLQKLQARFFLQWNDLSAANTG